MIGGVQRRTRGPEPTPWLEIDDVAAWRTYALCRGLGADLFFPVGVASSRGLEQAEGAKAVCRTCPVREPRLEFAFATNQDFGVWGGLTEEERRPLRRPRRCTTGFGAAPADPEVGQG